MSGQQILALMGSHVALGTALALILTLVQRLTTDSAAARHRAWALALMTLVAMPLLSFVPANQQSVTIIPASTLADTSPAATQAAASPAQAAAQAAKPPEGPPNNIEAANQTLKHLLLAVWLALAALQLVSVLRALSYVRRLRGSGYFVSAALEAQASGIAGALGLTGPVKVRWSPAVSSPQTLGALSPVILLPATWRPSPDRRVIEHALAHELAHIRRGDHWWVWLQFVARLLFSFNPAIWYVCQQMNRQREAACDDWAISLGTSPKDYASSLISVAASLLPGYAPELAIPCLRSKNHLRRRIFHMLNPKTSHSTSATSRLTLLTAALCLTGAVAAAPHWAGIAPLLKVVISAEITDQRNNRQPQSGDGLLFAAWQGDSQEVASLLASGADPDQVYSQRDPRTPLLAAARKQHFQVLQQLIAAGADVNFHARGDETVLMTVAESSDPQSVELIQELLARGADPKVRIRGDGTPLIAAARGGNLPAVELLLAAGAPPDTWVDGDESAMFHAVVAGHTQVVQRLLAAGANPKVRYDGDGTPLMLAIRHGHDDIAQMLMDAGAPIDAGVKGDGSALIDAVRRNNIALIQTLLDAGADVNMSVRGDGNALINAARRGQLETSMLLIDRGADVNAQVPDDDTPLINAVWSDNAELVAALLERGADATLKGDFDSRLMSRRTPLNQSEPGSEIRRLLKAAGPK